MEEKFIGHFWTRWKFIWTLMILAIVISIVIWNFRSVNEKISNSYVNVVNANELIAMCDFTLKEECGLNVSNSNIRYNTYLGEAIYQTNILNDSGDVVETKTYYLSCLAYDAIIIKQYNESNIDENLDGEDVYYSIAEKIIDVPTVIHYSGDQNLKAVYG